MQALNPKVGPYIILPRGIETAQTTLNMAKKLSKQNRTKHLHLTKPVTGPARETQAFLRSTPLTLGILGRHTFPPLPQRHKQK